MSVLDDLRFKEFRVLDQGHVMLVDAMGDDHAIADAARISYGKGTRRVSEDRDLIRYLMRHRHSTPFEMAEIKLRVRVPMDCWRQWIRHRAASVNEYSTRYSEAIDAMQATSPDGWRLQAGDNKQGSSGTLDRWTGEDGGPNRWNTSPEYGLDHAARITAKRPMDEPMSPGEALSIVEAAHHREARRVYEQRLAIGVAREQARKDLPLSSYTEAYWKCDLRNVLHFLGLRLDAHAQHEIREYARVIAYQIVAPLFPITFRAFQDYHLDALTLSMPDVAAIQAIRSGWSVDEALETTFKNKREAAECREKLTTLGLI